MTNQPSGSAKAWKLLEDNRFPLSGDCYGLHMREVDAEKLALAIDAAIKQAVDEAIQVERLAVAEAWEKLIKANAEKSARTEELEAEVESARIEWRDFSLGIGYCKSLNGAFTEPATPDFIAEDIHLTRKRMDRFEDEVEELLDAARYIDDMILRFAFDGGALDDDTVASLGIDVWGTLRDFRKTFGLPPTMSAEEYAKKNGGAWDE